MGRLMRMGEVCTGLEVPHGWLSRRLADMGITMVKARTKRDEWECELMERAEQAVPLGRRTDGEAGAGPGIHRMGEGHTPERGGPSAHFLGEKGDG
jgi:hypothetical protein